MNKYLVSAATVALIIAAPASAQILGGGGGGGLGGLGGGLGGSIGGTIGGTIERGRTTAETTTRVRGSTRVDRELRARKGTRGVTSTVTGDAAIDNSTRLGERRIVTRQSAAADGRLSLDQRMLRTRGVAAATARGLRRVQATASGVQVFVPRVALPAPVVLRVAVRAYPAYSGYYYEPGAVFVGSSHVDVYMDRQHQDLETSLRGTGAKVERRGNDLVVMLPADVTFAFDRADIRPRFYGALTAFARTMRNYPGTDVEVVGHTDAVGSEAYNLSLSERRGRSVAEFLVSHQAEPSRLVVEAMGEAEPVASNTSVEGRAANRRVELIVHPRAG